MKILRSEDLSPYTTFKISCIASEVFFPKNKDEISQALQKNSFQLTIGWGSNILLPDEGLSGKVMILRGHPGEIKIGKEKAIAGAGVFLPLLVNKLAEHGLSGLEFCCGIPGTVGGATVMNAGVGELCISKFIDYVAVIDEKGNEKKLFPQDLNFGYRTSLLQKKKWVVVEAAFNLKPDDKKNIQKRIITYKEKRQQAQPLNPSAGSVFKNPLGQHAAQLIDQAGCKSMRIGEAQVSEKHAGFIINLGEAKSQDVKDLIKLVQEKVQDKFSILLEPEIIII